MNKKITLLCGIMFFILNMTVFAQNKTVTLHEEQSSIQTILSKIEKQTKYLFVYDKAQIDVKRKVTLKVNNKPVSQVLNTLFAGTQVSYSLNGNNIVLTVKKGNTPQKSSIKTVEGAITDLNGEPIIGATVKEEGTNNGVISDIDGKFSIKVHPGAHLNVSYVGMITKTISVTGKSFLNITLTEDSKTLEEVVVVGYGTQKRVNLTGAISTVSSKDLIDRPASTATHMLQGKVPGLNITTSSGNPGNGASINIRGTNSINGGSPLVLIDGVEGDLYRVNPADIESISIIKDASSAAIYGARASFGVVLVTTKDGDEGKVRVSYNGRFGWTKPTVSVDYETRGYYSVLTANVFWNAYTGVNYMNYTEDDMLELWLRRNDKTEDPSRPWTVVKNRNGRPTYHYYANTDFWHHLFQENKPLMNHDISISGGTKKMKYFLSGGYNQEEGMIKKNTDKFNKTNFRSKISFDVNDYVNISNNTAFFHSKYTFPNGGGSNWYFDTSQTHGLACFPTQNPDGTSIVSHAFNGYRVMNGLLALRDKGKHTSGDRTDDFSTTTELTITPIKGLELKGNFTYNVNNRRIMNRYVPTEYSQYPGEVEILDEPSLYMENRLKEETDYEHYLATNLYATYSGSFLQKHNYKVTAGFNYETKYMKYTSSYGYNLMSETLNDFNLIGEDSEGERRMEVKGGQNEYALAGYFGRINYDYAGKYLLELSGRYDGSSRFSSKDRWGFFPSASVGWRLSEESFMAPTKSWLSNLKFRYSYGNLGNQQVGYYDYIRTVNINTQSYLFGGKLPSSASISAPVSGNLTWEVVEHHNLGLDASFLNNRLNFTGEYYIRNTKDMLTAGISLPAVYGTSSPKMNSADMQTKGYELSLGWQDMFKLAGKPFAYQINLTFNDYISKITKFNNPEKAFAKKYYEGMRIGEIWGYHIDGMFATDEEAANYKVDQRRVNDIINSSSGSLKGLHAGDLRFADLDGDDIISTGEDTVDDPGDRRIIGNSEPRYQYGANMAFQWCGFDFSIFFQGIGRMDWYPASEAELFWGPFNRPYATFLPKNFLEQCWSEDNPDAYFPRPRAYVAFDNLSNQNRELTAANDRYLQNIGYCRLKNLTIGYSLPKQWTQKIGIDLLRVYFSGENLAYWSGIKTDYIDPEQARRGGDLKVYPWQKTFTFGINVNF
ncbi:TonB-dependent receptor [Bacteroides sp. AN502(2024)]|uniref:TonB-dependent receptor n=1 Tax=Bacteroides sp. AN502(2024) TaxID=3160599 RepID=UPI003516AF79